MSDVKRVADIPRSAIEELLGRYGIGLSLVDDDRPITGSFWGEPEAGVVGRYVYVRNDTPLHSMLHEACHIVCMTEERRRCLDRDAGGDDAEESAVCYLQILLADYLPGVGRGRLMRDMDLWGYSFRLGSAARWFGEDAEDAAEWLVNHGLMTTGGDPVFRLRGC